MCISGTVGKSVLLQLCTTLPVGNTMSDCESSGQAPVKGHVNTCVAVVSFSERAAS